MVTTIITVMAAYSNERVAAIILSVLYRMLTFIGVSIRRNTHCSDCSYVRPLHLQ